MGSRARPVSHCLHAHNNNDLARREYLILSQYVPPIGETGRVQAQRCAKRPILRYCCLPRTSPHFTLTEAAAPIFKSSQAKDYYHHHGHPHAVEEVHKAKTDSPIQHCEPVACVPTNTTDRDAVKHVSSYSKVPATPFPPLTIDNLLTDV